MRDDPDILIFIYHHPIIIIGIKCALDIILFPNDLTTFAINTHQFTIGRHEDHTLLALRVGRNAKLLGELIGAIAKGYVADLLSHWVKIVEAIFISLNPIILLGIYMKALNTAFNTLRIQPAPRISIDFFRHWIIKRIVHTLFQPKSAPMSFLYLVNTVIAQCGRILFIREIRSETIAIITIQAIASSKPHIAL